MAEDFAEQLKRIKANLLKEIEDETAYRAENGPKPTYTSSTGKNVQWNEWLRDMLAAVKDLDAQIDAQAGQEDPYELRTTGWT